VEFSETELWLAAFALSKTSVCPGFSGDGKIFLAFEVLLSTNRLRAIVGLPKPCFTGRSATAVIGLPLTAGRRWIEEYVAGASFTRLLVVGL
jgi:hypothetical protein